MTRRRWAWAWWGVAALLLAAALLPHAWARALADRLAADGSAEGLTGWVWLGARAVLAGAGLLLAGWGALLRYAPGWLNDERAAWRADARAFGAALAGVFSAPVDALCAAGLALAALLTRLLPLGRPMGHDEAYTFIAFASRPLWAVMTDYHLPNNHIFHTILVHFSTQGFGIAPWAVRLPAVIAGILTAPAVYALARAIYGRPAGLAAGALAATLEVGLLYSANARGYSLIILFSTLLFGLAYGLGRRFNRAAWLAFIVVSTLGLYTLPNMLFPLGGALLWWVWLAWPGRAGRARWALLGWAAAALALAGALTALLYAPVVFFGTGLNSIIANPFVKPVLLPDLPDVLWGRLQDTWFEWRRGLPPAGATLLGVGALLGVLLQRWAALEGGVPALVPLALASAALMVIQRPYPQARMWVFALPVFWCAVGAGWVTAVNLLTRRWLARERGAWAAALLACALLGGLAWANTRAAYPGWQPAPGEPERVALFLQMQLQAPTQGDQPGDVVVISSEDAPPLWYYLRLHGMDDRAYTGDLERGVFRRAFVVVKSAQGQTLESAIEARGMDLARFQLDQAAVVFTLGGSQVILVPERK